MWHQADGDGRRVLITAATNETVSAVNTLIQKRRLEQFDIGGTPVTIDGGKAYVNDVVTTRRNDRDLTTDRGITVANRHTFEVISAHSDGSVTVAGKTGTVTLPAAYFREYVQLAYATTAHGAPGRTVDQAVRSWSRLLTMLACTSPLPAAAARTLRSFPSMGRRRRPRLMCLPGAAA